MNIVLTNKTAADIASIHAYIAQNDSQASADYVIDRIEEAARSLAKFPHRGPHPQELLQLGFRQYRELFFKPYRIVYRADDKNAYILLIADGRRDLRTLFYRRLLES